MLEPARSLLVIAAVVVPCGAVLADASWSVFEEGSEGFRIAHPSGWERTAVPAAGLKPVHGSPVRSQWRIKMSKAGRIQVSFLDARGRTPGALLGKPGRAKVILAPADRDVNGMKGAWIGYEHEPPVAGVVRFELEAVMALAGDRLVHVQFLGTPVLDAGRATRFFKKVLETAHASAAPASSPSPPPPVASAAPPSVSPSAASSRVASPSPAALPLPPAVTSVPPSAGSSAVVSPSSGAPVVLDAGGRSLELAAGGILKVALKLEYGPPGKLRTTKFVAHAGEPLPVQTVLRASRRSFRTNLEASGGRSAELGWRLLSHGQGDVVVAEGTLVAPAEGVPPLSTLSIEVVVDEGGSVQLVPGSWEAMEMRQPRKIRKR